MVGISEGGFAGILIVVGVFIVLFGFGENGVGAESENPGQNQALTDQNVRKNIAKDMLKLVPSEKESRIFIELATADTGKVKGSWSLLVPECVSSREGITKWCHTMPPKWTQIEKGWAVELQLEQPKCIYTSRIVILDEETVQIDFTIKNIGEEQMTDTEADFCFCCAAQPEFSSKDWYDRSYVLTPEGFVAAGDMRVNFPVAFNPEYAQFGKNIATVPVIMCKSLDGKKVYAGGFDRCTRLSTSVGTCIHAVAWLGTLEPGERVTRRGRFYYLTGELKGVVERFKKDFGL